MFFGQQNINTAPPKITNMFMNGISCHIQKSCVCPYSMPEPVSDPLQPVIQPGQPRRHPKPLGRKRPQNTTFPFPKGFEYPAVNRQ
jgi:hypothetical protein